MNRRSIIAIGTGLLLVLAVLAVDIVAPPPDPEAIEPAEVAAAAPVAGSSTCVVGDGREGTGLAVTAARPGEVGEGPAQVEIVGFEQGGEERIAVPPVFPGVHAHTAVEGGEDLASSVAWRGGPVAVHREWRLEGDDELPAGTIAGPCPSTISDRYVIPGMITVGGSEARVRVANPFGTDATVAVGFVTPEGPEQPLALQNLSVPARGTLEVDVNEVLPERADLSAVVRVLSGRAVAEGYQLTRAAIGDIDGASLLAASTAPSETWTVPWVAGGGADESWLWVVNLGDRPAPVELTLHTTEGGIPPEGLSEVTVAPGQLRRIDLRGTVPEGSTAVGITARSDGAPVHVSGVVQRSADQPAGTGFVVQLGVARADGSWVVSGGAVAEGRRERLRVVNPGSEASEVSLTLFNGSAVSRPEDLAAFTLGPGESRELALDEALAGAPSWSAFVQGAGGEIVVGRVGAGGAGDGLHLVAAPGTPSSAWGPVSLGLPVRAVPGTVQQLGTAVGVRPEDPLRDTDEPAPTPSPEPEAEPEPDAEPDVEAEEPDPDAEPDEPEPEDADPGEGDPDEDG
jgi:hypothetical protein